MFPLFRYTRFKWCVRNNSTNTPKEIAENILKNEAPKNEFKDEEDIMKITNEILKEYPEAPTTCCMSGCPTCVWFDYADKLIEYYKDGGDKALKDIEEQITDTNLKAYLLHEIRMRTKR